MASAESEYATYGDHADWSDLTPVPQEDVEGIVAINYSERFREVYGYMRAIIELDEKSPRAFRLTKDAIQMNAANYTVWAYRRQIIEHMSLDIREELDVLAAIIYSHPKNYQVWEHRKWLIMKLKEAQDREKELLFTANVLKDDSKNFHCWQYRQFVCRHFKDFSGELEFTQALVCDDLFNNSAWNYRFYTISLTTGFSDPSVVDREVKFTMEFIEAHANNESAWSYLIGVTKSRDFPEEIVAYAESLRKQDLANAHSMHYLSLYYQSRLSSNDGVAARENLTSIFDKLVQIDTIRTNYWRYRKNKALGGLTENTTS